MSYMIVNVLCLHCHVFMFYMLQIVLGNLFFVTCPFVSASSSNADERGGGLLAILCTIVYNVGLLVTIIYVLGRPTFYLIILLYASCFPMPMLPLIFDSQNICVHILLVSQQFWKPLFVNTNMFLQHPICYWSKYNQCPICTCKMYMLHALFVI